MQGFIGGGRSKGEGLRIDNGSQIEAQLNRVVPVRKVTNWTAEKAGIEREMALIKVAGTGEKRMEALRMADADVLPEALRLAERLAAGPKGAYGKSKQLLAGAGALESHMALESQTIARQAVTAEGQEGITAFLEKRKPKFT